MLRAMKEKTATTVNMTVGMSITTAEPTFVPKKEMVAIQPLQEDASCGATQRGEGHPGVTPPNPGKGPSGCHTEGPHHWIQRDHLTETHRACWWFRKNLPVHGSGGELLGHKASSAQVLP